MLEVYQLFMCVAFVPYWVYNGEVRVVVYNIVRKYFSPSMPAGLMDPHKST